VLQTHWQASNKSKRCDALAAHVLIYTSVLGVATAVIFQIGGFAALFVAVNGILHFATDFITSRISSRLFMAQFDSVDIVMPPLLTGPMKKRTEPRLMMRHDFNPHWFFVMIGVDQLIHQVTLALTMKVFFGWN
jgi:hypothetical protein